MQSHYDQAFERDMGCTEAEWLGWLPAAIGDKSWQQGGACVRVALEPGSLKISWQTAAPRLLGQVRIPRLLAGFAFEGVDAERRHAFMKRFDLYMQRGGG